MARKGLRELSPYEDAELVEEVMEAVEREVENPDSREMVIAHIERHMKEKKSKKTEKNAVI